MNKIISKYCLYYPVVYLKGERVLQYLKEYNTTQWYSLDKIEKYQFRKFKLLLEYAIKNVPFYKNNLKYAKTENIKCLKDISSLPSIDKNILRDNSLDLCSENIHRLASKKTTGGSTGQAVTVTKTTDSLAMERAATWRSYTWAGIDIGDPQGRFWGVPFNKADKVKSRLTDLVSNRIRLSAFEFNEADLFRYYKKLSIFKPKYLYGYVSMIHTFAQFMESNGLKIQAKFQCVITTSEVLTSPIKNFISNIFECRVFNEYGCGEVGSIAHECEEGSMHIMSENVFVEILNGNEIVKNGEAGEIVVTELNNYAMPLIRYRLADYAIKSHQTCTCGRGLPLLKNMVGRAYDIIHAPNGKKFHGEFFMYIFEDVKKQQLGVKQFQVVQTGKNILLIKIVPDKNFNCKAKEIISNRVQHNTNMEVSFELVSFINREKSGKLRIIKALEG